MAVTVEGGHLETYSLDSPLAAFAALIIGLVTGCISFVVLDQIVNAHGGFLRKSATTVAWFAQKKKQRQIEILRDLSSVELFQSIPDAAIQDLVDLVKPVHFNRDETLFKQGDQGEDLYFIRDGEVDLYQEGVKFKSLTSGSILGEMSLLTGGSRSATAKANKGVHCLMLRKDSFDQLRGEYPDFDRSVRNIVSQRIDELSQHWRAKEQADEEWAERATKTLN